MFFVGIDIGKRNHEVALVDEKGSPIGKTLIITNTKKGSLELLNFFNKHDVNVDNAMIGMEATGHYWLAIYSFLNDLDFSVTAFNPIQSDVLRDFYIRKTKTDAIDAVLIAQVIRMDLPEKTSLPTEDIFRLKQLERFRYSLVDSSSDLKRKIITCLDQVFPEYEKIFSDIFGSSSTEILLNSPLPEDILQLDTELLIETIHLASKKRFGIEHSEKKVMKLKELASNSFGISIAADVSKLEIQIMLEQIRLIERQIIQIESEIHEIIATQDNYLTTITGIGDITAAVIMGEIGDINRFKKPSQLLAFAGLDASVHQSGDFTGTKNKLSKRGSPYLRRAIWQAAFIAAFHDPALSIYYQKLKQRGKSHGTAVGAVSRKMVNIIFAVWTQNKPYEVHLPKNIDVN